MRRPEIRLGALCLLLAASCASKLPQIESGASLRRGRTYAYGYAEVSGASELQIWLKNGGKNFKYEESWIGIPFRTKEILFAFDIAPGAWNLNSVSVKSGGQFYVTMIEENVVIQPGKGHYLGRFTVSGTDTKLENFPGGEGKGEVDRMMRKEYPSLDPDETVVISAP